VSQQQIVLTAPQRAFVNSKARYPAFVGSWGCGKTMCGILRGLGLSETFPNNLGLIVRKKFTDLRDSTLKDFERYTGLSVRKDDKEVKLPNKSVIMFRHGEELSGLQNVNLGWFMIEQTEEFDTSEQFDLLRGRLRRAECPVRQGMVIANTNGHNWIWDAWKRRKLPEHELVEANIEDVRGYIPADTIADWERMQVENPRKYNRYVLNSWEDYDLEGAFYAALMSDALKEGRVGIDTLYESAAPVYTFWDLGLRASDTTAIWFAQFVRDEIWLIDYYENHSEGMGHYVKVIGERPYNYGAHYLPPDAVARMQGEVVQTRLQIIQTLRPQDIFHVVEREPREVGIEAVRGLLHKCKFGSRCAAGVDALNHYQKKKNEILSTEARPAFAPEPLHDWSSNGADAFRYLAIQYRYGQIDDKPLGYPYPMLVADEEGDASRTWNPMTDGLLAGSRR